MAFEWSRRRISEQPYWRHIRPCISSQRSCLVCFPTSTSHVASLHLTHFPFSCPFGLTEFHDGRQYHWHYSCGVCLFLSPRKGPQLRWNIQEKDKRSKFSVVFPLTRGWRSQLQMLHPRYGEPRGLSSRVSRARHLFPLWIDFFLVFRVVDFCERTPS